MNRSALNLPDVRAGRRPGRRRCSVADQPERTHSHRGDAQRSLQRLSWGSPAAARLVEACWGDLLDNEDRSVDRCVYRWRPGRAGREPGRPMPRPLAVPVLQVLRSLAPYVTVTGSSVNGQVAVPAGGQVKVPTPRVDQLVLSGGSSSGSGLSHAVGVAVGDDDVAWCRSRSSRLTAVVCSGRNRPQDRRASGSRCPGRGVRRRRRRTGTAAGRRCRRAGRSRARRR